MPFGESLVHELTVQHPAGSADHIRDIMIRVDPDKVTPAEDEAASKWTSQDANVRGPNSPRQSRFWRQRCLILTPQGYCERMPAPLDDEDAETSSDVWASRARQWYRASLALAILFASLPLTAKLLLGSWGFDGALEIACLFLAAAAYLYFAGRKDQPTIPDSAAILDEAIRQAALGQADRGLALLDEALRLSPGLWQARQYRGELRLAASDAMSALQDFTEAIRLAPDEPHLYILRSHVFTLLGRDSSASADLEAAARMGGDAEPRQDGS